MSRDLNPAQRRAVEHATGPLLVLAGPGSGKTRVVTHRIARLLERGVPATAILAVTFTNKAAREMRTRVRALVGERAKGLTVATFHAACVRILREEIEALGYTRRFSIYDESSQQSLLRAVLRDLEATGSPSDVLAEISAAKSGIAPASLAGKPSVGDAAGESGPAPGPLAKEVERRAHVERAAVRYQEELRARNAIDFDDIILLTARLFRERPDIRERWRQRFTHVLVDEYQDTNASQEEVLSLLCGPAGDAARSCNLCVVGDDDQSIYGWRGAEVEHILGFQERFVGTSVVRLERNYRSTGNVVAVANAVIAGNARRHAKTVFTEMGPGDPVRVLDLPDEKEEADFVAGEIAAALSPGGNAWRDASRFAVLVRTNEQLRPIEQGLRQARVPYRLLGGRSFFDRKEVLDVLAYLRLAANEADEEAFFRIANVPARGLGAGALETLAAMSRPAGLTPWHVARQVAGGAAASGLTAKVVAGLTDLVAIVTGLQAAGERRVRTLVTDFLERSRYQDEIDRTYKDAGVRASRWALAQEVQRSWETYLADADRPSVSGFLDAVTLRSNDQDDTGEERGATLATIHASKGLEFPVVFVAGMEEGILPHGRSRDDRTALEEERRLVYVAVTRAAERLYLTRAATRTVRGRSVETVPSRFLEGLPEDALERGLSRAPASPDRVASSLARVRAMLGEGAG